MNNIRDILESIYAVFDIVYFIWLILLYYLAIKKCFWKREKGRIKLFFVTLVLNPIAFFTLAAFAGPRLFSLLLQVFGLSTERLPGHIGINSIWMFFSGIIIVLLIYLFSGLIAKWLEVPNREFVTFVGLMHSVVVTLSMRDDFDTGADNWLFDIVTDIAADAVLFIASILLYCFVIKALAALSDRKRESEPKLFIVPPALFIILNNMFLTITGIYEEKHYFKDGAFLVVLFSDIILLLFIWAFHIITKNINATNEALEAKERAAKMEIEEARIEADLSVARSIQISALPSDFPPFPERKEFELYASMNAAKEVGGDFYDFYMTDQDTLGFLIADVSGKGIPAAMFMMRGKTIIKSLAENKMPAAEVFTVANEKLCEGNDAELFITAWMGYLDLKSGTVHVANAGHNPPVLIRDGKAEYVILKPGLMLAGMDGMIYKEQQLELKKGDILYLYTDGVTEAMDADENQYGEDRLLKLLSFGDDYPAPSEDNGIAGAVCELVAKDIEAFVQGAEQSDDITMLCVRYLGGS